MNAMGMSGIPSFLQALAALAEFGGGIALVLGLLTPIAAFGIVCQMVGALILVHFPRGDPFVAPSPGASSYELPLVYLVLTVLLIAPGPGKWALDALLFGERRLAGEESAAREGEPFKHE